MEIQLDKALLRGDVPEGSLRVCLSDAQVQMIVNQLLAAVQKIEPVHRRWGVNENDALCMTREGRNFTISDDDVTCEYCISRIKNL